MEPKDYERHSLRLLPFYLRMLAYVVTVADPFGSSREIMNSIVTRGLRSIALHQPIPDPASPFL
jgi:hypothetical protein